MMAQICSIISGGAGELTTTPAAPCISETAASCTARLPVGVPPPTPTNTGASEAVSSACVMAGCAVKGYTAKMASALELRMTATSVV